MCAYKNFIDNVEIFIKSGHGGAGSVHFRHEKNIEKGGPDGGDGGKGGDIIFLGDDKLSTLYKFQHKRHFVADDGENGGEKKCHGKDGDDIIIKVPIGTSIIDKTTNKIIADITKNMQKSVILRGGKGGLGNTHFKNALNQTPRYAQPGLPGEEKNVILELKLLADVGLVGLPNAGKSTLLAVISNARPKIADYAFTTLTPQLGIVNYKNNSFVVADLPGLIEGAAEGKGLGLRFLKHIERIKMLVYVIDCSTDILKTFDTLQNELKKYNALLLQKKFIICVSKCDTIDENKLDSLKKIEIKNITMCFISSLQNKNIDILLDTIISLL